MTGLKDMLLEEQKRLEYIIQKAEQELLDAPEGTMRLSVNKGKAQFYHCTDYGNSNGKYIKKDDGQIVKNLAQKIYDEKIIRKAKRRLSQIKRITKDYKDNEIEEIYSKMHQERKKLVTPIVSDWEQELKLWMKREYKGKDFKEGSPVIYTEKGERVRSKSEKILADYFYHHNIPYKYECPLALFDGRIVYPDFTFLSPKTRKEIYWEHDGKMDDPAYIGNAIKKIDAYEKSGIYMGERLILTFETSECVLNSETIENYARRYLK